MVFVLMAQRAETGVAKHFSLLTHIFTPLLTEPQGEFDNSHKNIQTDDGETGALFLVIIFL